ncbi:glyoxalase [Frankia sp. R43]|uniref:VOC family protein n=1 Tax=Frankia sp. R43 TaxID=269536 RepID=UPI0006C9EA06|nr:VOC family protein [Frankia sp. R43]KPM54078.1 glyoxalase [Frankia sp. R43]
MSRPEHSLFEQDWPVSDPGGGPAGEFRFFQLGFLVDDLLEAAARWAQVFGVGPFHVMPVVDQHATYRGEPATVTIQVAVAQAGPVQIELVKQLCDRPGIYREWRRGRVSALHQLCTVTPDYEGRKAHYERLGYELACESASGSFRVAYFDTSADFGFYTEVVEQTPKFLVQLDRISRTCAEWDGTDPVRLITRGGYQVPRA